MTTPPTPTFTKPEGIILVKGQANQGNGKEVYGIWPSGYSRQITAAEYTLWGTPAVDYTIPKGDDAQFNQLRAYDAALRA